MTVVEKIVELFEYKGDSEYGGEAVTQLQHALQCALLAEQEGATPELISAALLHDIGHLLHQLPNDAPDRGVDDVHEELGWRYLSKHFVPSVSEPVRMHVAAKRYLCATDSDYQSQLSQPSVTSLMLQGGPMNADEVNEFESSSHWREAVRLRKWDDLAKVKDLVTPTLDHFASYLTASMNEGESDG